MFAFCVSWSLFDDRFGVEVSLKLGSQRELFFKALSKLFSGGQLMCSIAVVLIRRRACKGLRRGLSILTHERRKNANAGV